MASGPDAREVACMECLSGGHLTKATRVYEGLEDDHYGCERGHEFGIDWSRAPADGPQWPPPPDVVASVKG